MHESAETKTLTDDNKLLAFCLRVVRCWLVLVVGAPLVAAAELGGHVHCAPATINTPTLQPDYHHISSSVETWSPALLTEPSFLLSVHARLGTSCHTVCQVGANTLIYIVSGSKCTYYTFAIHTRCHCRMTPPQQPPLSL